MIDVERYIVRSGDEPAPCFASEAEIAIADRLRHQLEERYLGQTAAGGSPTPQTDEGR